jgi:hypothetical protein
MVKIKRLTEEIGFDYTNKAKTDTSKPPIKRGNPMLEMIMPMLKPIVRSAYDAGKSGTNFDQWWEDFKNSEFEMPERERPVRPSMGFKR